VDASVGSVGDAYDNALAETTIGLFKTELIHSQGPWRTRNQVELATLEYVDWYNHASHTAPQPTDHQPNLRTSTIATNVEPRQLPNPFSRYQIRCDSFRLTSAGTGTNSNAM